jgi:hypothetical protein
MPPELDSSMPPGTLGTLGSGTGRLDGSTVIGELDVALPPVGWLAGSDAAVVTGRLVGSARPADGAEVAGLVATPELELLERPPSGGNDRFGNEVMLPVGPRPGIGTGTVVPAPAGAGLGTAPAPAPPGPGPVPAAARR